MVFYHKDFSGFKSIEVDWFSVRPSGLFHDVYVISFRNREVYCIHRGKMREIFDMHSVEIFSDYRMLVDEVNSTLSCDWYTTDWLTSLVSALTANDRIELELCLPEKFLKDLYTTARKPACFKAFSEMYSAGLTLFLLRNAVGITRMDSLFNGDVIEKSPQDWYSHYGFECMYHAMSPELRGALLEKASKEFLDNFFAAMKSDLEFKVFVSDFSKEAVQVILSDVLTVSGFNDLINKVQTEYLT